MGVKSGSKDRRKQRSCEVESGLPSGLVFYVIGSGEIVPVDKT